jgi:hypothetical protein
MVWTYVLVLPPNNRYTEETKPLIEHYSAKGVLKSFTGTESDIIYPQIEKFLIEELKIPTVA